MESLIIRLNMIVVIVYVLLSFLKGSDYKEYLLTAVSIFLISSLLMLTIHYVFLKILLSAKVKVVKEDMYDRFVTRQRLKDMMDNRLEEIEKEEAEQGEDSEDLYSKLFKRKGIKND
ncbi:MAG: hypothetical protein JXR48_07970 [Candidatus Delongbacteria bacterium]|nr:hypothetical protein [Candidatus Delongbacteria bacterium]MBN2834889.1 hypothetical protein [Candidatus Delongbacteria bacterium]